ncbi:MAG: oligoendopeptidase F [Candidatus Kapabacteria bacterium]|nr:oligoendopeptidase F [Candidatus Kapabacteria bacterium]
MLNAQNELPERKDVADKYKWNITDIFKSAADWNKEYSSLENDVKKFTSYKGKISKSAKELHSYLEYSSEIGKRFSRAYLYASLGRDTDLISSDFQVMFEKMQKLGAELSSLQSFATPEILSISESDFLKFLKDEPKLKAYEHELKGIFKMKPHTLTADEENLIAKLSPISQIPNNTYSILNDAELPFPSIQLADGSEVKLSHGRYRAALYALDRDYRKAVYKGTYEPYNALKGTFAALYNGRLKTRIINSEIRNYKSPIEAALSGNDIPVSVYENLVNVTNENLKTLHRWASIKKRALKLDELHPYDTYVTLFPSTQKEYTYDEAVEISLKALAPLGKEYVDAVKFGFDNRWIDVYETKNKRSGAYSNSSGAGPHPFILLNWNNTLDDVFTLVHEIGHNMHSFFSEKNQPFHYAGYSIFVAEVASITNEALLLDYLVENAESKEEKMALLEKFLTGAQATFFRQTRFAEFEKETHDRGLKGEVLTEPALTKIFADMYQKYWGPEMVTDYEEGLSWARVHHLVKYNFYVYQYATGFAAAQALAEQIKNEGKPAIDRYLGFLSSGSSDYPLNVLNKAGVDMSTKAPIEATISRINKYLDELEKLMSE